MRIHSTYPGRRVDQKGMVLLMVLMIFALASIVSSELSYQSHREILRSSNILYINEAYMLAKGGEAFAIRKLISDFEQDQELKLKTDFLTEAWAVESEPFEVTGLEKNDIGLETGELVEEAFLDDKKDDDEMIHEIGSVKFVIEDLQARFNLNNVTFDKDQHRSGHQQLESVITAILAAGISSGNSYNVNDEAVAPGDLALAVLDWVDQDADSALVTGAEDRYYLQRNPPYKAANQQMSDISELRAIKGFNVSDTFNKLVPVQFVPKGETELDQGEQAEDGENLDSDSLSLVQYDADGNVITEEQTSAELIWGSAQHYLSVLPEPTRVNVNTASAVVLESLFTSADASQIVEGRKNSPYQKVEDIFLNLTEIDKKDYRKYTDYLSVESQYFQVTSIASIEETSFVLRSKLYRRPDGEIRVIARDFSY